MPFDRYRSRCWKTCPEVSCRPTCRVFDPRAELGRCRNAVRSMPREVDFVPVRATSFAASIVRPNIGASVYARAPDLGGPEPLKYFGAAPSKYLPKSPKTGPVESMMTRGLPRNSRKGP